jgi:hypothetical protein
MSKTESAKFTVSVKTAIKHRLKKLAKIAGRSSSVLVTEGCFAQQPRIWPHWARSRDERAGHPKDAFHRAVSGERAVARNLAHLSRRTTPAGGFLKRSND